MKGWLARLREALVEQGVFSLKPLPRTRAETELETAGTPPAGDLTRLALDEDRPEPSVRGQIPRN